VSPRPGQPVRTRLHAAPGHTRLPLYARGRTGTVHALRGHFPFADDLAKHGRAGEQALYSVRFIAADLWGPEAGGHLVCLDLFESYLEAP
jgi:hypothetical protein